jgi:hypothetical protein
MMLLIDLALTIGWGITIYWVIKLGIKIWEILGQ